MTIDHPTQSAYQASTFIWLTLAFCLLSFSAQGQITDGVLRNADQMFYDLEKKTIKLDGNVQVVFQGQHVSCDHAEINQKTEVITAYGNVIMTGERIHVEGDRIVFNYKKDTGFIYNGFVQSGQVIFEGSVIEKLSANHFLASDAKYTACETCPPGWSFSGRSIDAELGGYARIKRPIFRIAGFPILMLPGIIVPLKSSRQSGVIVPKYGFSKSGGLDIAGNYFWAIDRSQDATFTAKWYELRGLKAQSEYRYVLSEESRGHLRGAWIKDRVLKEEYRFTKDINRYFIAYNHIYEMPANYVQRADLTLVSDLRYNRDFSDELKNYGDPAIENKVSITKSVDDQYMSIEAGLYTNLLHHDPLARNEDAVHRAPEIRYSIKEQFIANTGLLASMDLNYVNFSRNTFRYDDLVPCQDNITSAPKKPCISDRAPLGAPVVGSDLSGGTIHHDGTFNPATDLYRTGQRLDVKPSISYPFHLSNKIDFLPTITYRETQYRFDPPCTSNTGDCQPAFAQTAARRYVETNFWAKTEFNAIFGSNDPGTTKWKHSIEPQIGYAQIPWMRRPNHMFFGDNIGQQYSNQFEPITDTDLGNPSTGIQFDYNDRTYDKRVVNFLIRNRITEKKSGNENPSYKTIVLFNVDQSYDFTEARRKEHPHPWSPINALLDVRLDRFETNTTISHNTYANKTNTSTRFKLMRSTGDYLQVRYTQKFLLNDTDFSLEQNGETRNVGLGLGFVTKYLEADGELEFSDITHQIQSWRYGLRVRPPGNCWLILIDHRQFLGGDASINASLNFDFGGETSGTKIQ